MSNNSYLLLVAGYYIRRIQFFHSLCQLTPFHQDAVTATETDEADVRAKADHFPVRAAAGMGLAQTNDVIEFQFGEHIWRPRGIITCPCYNPASL